MRLAQLEWASVGAAQVILTLIPPSAPGRVASRGWEYRPRKHGQMGVRRHDSAGSIRASPGPGSWARVRARKEMRYFVNLDGTEHVIDVAELPGGGFDVTLEDAQASKKK